MLVLVFFATILVATTPAMALSPGQDFNGPHYTLNVIGVQKDKNPTAEGWFDSERHTLFVPLDRKINLYMQQGDAFAVIDADGTDGTARFQLGPGYYEVYAVALGKPNGYTIISPEATFNATTATTEFYLGSIQLEHAKKPSWQRVTGLFIADVALYDSDGALINEYDNTWIFNIPELLSYWWNYDNHGCKLLQVRFYPVAEQPVVTPSVT